MRKMLVALLALLLAAACVWAEEAKPTVYTSGDWQYTLLEDGTAEIAGYKGQETQLTIPAVIDGYQVTSIGEGALWGCKFLKSVTIPDTVTSIRRVAFHKCSALTSVIIPDSVLRIEEMAFYACRSLMSVTIPNSVTSIGDYAFYWCSSLTSVRIPDSVTNIGANPFKRCDRLMDIIVSQEHPTLATIDGVLFDKIEKRLVCYPCGYTDSNYVIPMGIRHIGDCAFSRCYYLTNVTIADSVQSIGNSAFYSCDSLMVVTLPDSVIAIGEAAFADCDDLTLTIPRNSWMVQWCKTNNLRYMYPDSLDWLLE